MPQPLIIASQSAARRDMLQNAGLEIECQPARIDETAIKASLLAQNAPPRDIADALAEMKARRVAGKFPDRLVLGADQILVHKGKIFDKPTSLAEAKSQLLTLRGQSHLLFSAVVVYDQGAPVWRYIGRAELTMRDFTVSFLNTYMAQMEDDLFTTVGGYKLETLGSQLFLSVKGDYFSVLGLPLLEVLEFLRGKGICQT
ncbi:MAG TPA: septum formation protein Maf [Rhodobacteraceae bacterium]|nr:septum formation protein Maf [Paracoccaceae bacterium]